MYSSWAGANRCMSLALLVVALAAPLVNAACDAESLGADLHCSACQLFVDSYLVAANKPVFGTKRDKSPRGVYKQRISAIYKQHAPDKLRLVDGMLKVYKGREHALYQKVCYKYNSAIEPAYSKEDAESVEEEIAWKEGQAAIALEEVMKKVSAKDAQWAVSGKEGSRKYVDFNKAMNSGEAMDNLSMGGDVAKQLEECFQGMIDEHSGILTGALANSARLYDSGIDKTFCIALRACPKPTEVAESAGEDSKELKQREDDVQDASPDDVDGDSDVDDDVETVELDHDEL